MRPGMTATQSPWTTPSRRGRTASRNGSCRRFAYASSERTGVRARRALERSWTCVASLWNVRPGFIGGLRSVLYQVAPVTSTKNAPYGAFRSRLAWRFASSAGAVLHGDAHACQLALERGHRGRRRDVVGVAFLREQLLRAHPRLLDLVEVEFFCALG